jgi:hypothetical protein
MKQTVREKDMPDKLFLREWAENHGVKLEPAPKISPNTAPAWVESLLKWIRRAFSK